jgi:hypothetical protein
VCKSFPIIVFLGTVPAIISANVHDEDEEMVYHHIYNIGNPQNQEK